jgi:hypothetical protein
MPIVRLNNKKLIYFCHVPKCAGTSVEYYLKARFGSVGFIDPLFHFRSAAQAWTLSPPQHMPEVVREYLLPNNLFDHLFAVVRNPIERIKSVFLFQKYVENALPSSLSFERWIDGLARSIKLDPYSLNGHTQPMVSFVPTDAKVFRLEDGLDRLEAWLNLVSEDFVDCNFIPWKNRTSDRMKKDEPHIILKDTTIEKIRSIYSEDFSRFDY